MQSLNRFDLLFYAGSALIILFYVGVVMARFKDERIDLEEHKWLLLTYILLIVLSIWVWRYLFDLFLGQKTMQILTPSSWEL